MKAVETGIFELKTHLSEFVQRVERGETIVITKRGKPVAELVPPGQRRGPRPVRGYAQGRVRHLADDFDAPLADFEPQA